MERASSIVSSMEERRRELDEAITASQTSEKEADEILGSKDCGQEEYYEMAGLEHHINDDRPINEEEEEESDEDPTQEYVRPRRRRNPFEDVCEDEDGDDGDDDDDDKDSNDSIVVGDDHVEYEDGEDVDSSFDQDVDYHKYVSSQSSTSSTPRRGRDFAGVIAKYSKKKKTGK